MTDSLTTPSPVVAPSQLSPITVSVNLDALTENHRAIQSRLSKEIRILAIIKADAYGHGALRVAHTLKSLGIFGFGVASVQEGLTLRQGGIDDPILIMGAIQPPHLMDLIRFKLTPVISEWTVLERLTKLLPADGPSYPVHLKVDTGLHRLGMDADQIPSVFRAFQQPRSPVTIEGLMSHFADADNPDPALTNHQLTRFLTLLQTLETQRVRRPILHTANSAGILFHPDSHLDMVRPGLMLYGYAPKHPGQAPPIHLKPILEATTYIAHLRNLQPGEVVGYNAQFRTERPSKIAVLPVGYTHGIPRKLTGIGHVLIQGKPAPIIGKVCMDMMMIDVTEIPTPSVGEEVRLLGTQGEHTITAEDYARWLDTIPYEVLCGIGGKAQRRYVPQDLGTDGDPVNQNPARLTA